MKNKTLAGLLALFLGAFGVHRFYLGQVKYGLLYVFLLFFGVSFILGLIDAIIFLTMDQEAFDQKYNQVYQEYENPSPGRRRPPVRERKKYGPGPVEHSQRNTRKSHPTITRKKNPFKLSGIQKYKDYDFEGAIKDFNKALSVDSQDIAVHFNLACAYSITENAQKSLHHLSTAVEFGFVDFDKIEEHDALAYLRIQDEFEAFVKNGYCLEATVDSAAVAAPSVKEEANISIDLLEQIKKLGELREKGFLTEEEFVAQKRRLLK